MAWASKTYTFSASTVARAAEVNDNFDDMVDQLNIAMPSGAIILWSGSTASIPSGYYLCDGNNSTPDLRGRFIVGAGGAYAVADTGGEATHVLTIGELPTIDLDSYMSDPGHLHAMGITDGDQDGSGSNGAISGAKNTGSATTGITWTPFGSGTAHENRPPYYALAYIMKS